VGAISVLCGGDIVAPLEVEGNSAVCLLYLDDECSVVFHIHRIVDNARTNAAYLDHSPTQAVEVLLQANRSVVGNTFIGEDHLSAIHALGGSNFGARKDGLTALFEPQVFGAWRPTRAYSPARPMPCISLVVDLPCPNKATVLVGCEEETCEQEDIEAVFRYEVFHKE